MKCSQHNDEANSICVNCGVALCEACPRVEVSKKNCCSAICAKSVELMEEVAKVTLDWSTKTAKASSYGSYLLGLVFIGFAIYSFFYGIRFLGVYMALFGIGMIIMGLFYQKSSKSKSSVLSDKSY